MKNRFHSLSVLRLLAIPCLLLLDGCPFGGGNVVVTDPVTDMPALCKERIITVLVGGDQTIDVHSDAEVEVAKENEHIDVAVNGNQITVTGVSVGISKIAVNSGDLGQVVKVRVDEPKALQIDDAGLLITYTNQYTWIWEDDNSGAALDGSFWAPMLPEGYRSLGSVGQATWSSPNDHAIVCVKAINGSDALADPVDYIERWHAPGNWLYDAWVWEPVPPAGYAALGMVATKTSQKPELSAIACVKKSLLTPGLPGDQFWDDHDSGASTNFGGYYVAPPNYPVEEMKALIPTGGTFISRHDDGYRSPPATHPCMWVFNVVLPVMWDYYDVWNAPELTQPSAPLPMASHIVQQIGLPLGISKDPASGSLGLDWRVQNSPVYLLGREFVYNWSYGWDNMDGSEPQSMNWTSTTSYEDSKTEEFTTTHGIEVSMELGVDCKVFSGKTSFTYSYQWSHMTSTTITRSYSTSITRNVTVPAHTYVGLWQLNHRYKYYRRAETGEWQLIPDIIMSIPTEEVKTGEYP